MPLNKGRTFRRALLAALDATFPFQHRPPGKIILRQLGKYGAEINLPVTRRTKPSSSIGPGLVASVNALAACRTKFRILHVKHFNTAVIQIDELQIIDLYHRRIKMFHVKDAEFRPTGRQGVYGGYQTWANRAGRFRSPGDGQVDFSAIFSKLTQYDFPGWAVLEWECCIKSGEQGAAEGAPFIQRHIIQAAGSTFDDFASSGADQRANRRMLGLE